MPEYYHLPLRPSEIIQQQEHPKCTLQESVASMIHLITTSHFGEFKHDTSFGCEIWEHDFENIVNTQLYKDELKRSIQQTIEKHEPRLTNIRVDIQIEQIEGRIGTKRIKSRIRLHVRGSLSKTNESFSYLEHFFIGPLSYAL